MSKSIADQLMGLGLADKKQVQKDQAQKRKQSKQQRKHKVPLNDENKVAAEQARKEKAERDRELNMARNKAAEQKSLLAQIAQIVSHTKIESDASEIKFNFADPSDNKVKFIYVTEKVQDDLSRGRLAIVISEEKFYVVTKDVAGKIRARYPASLIFLAEQKTDDADEDDPYKDFVIPDDLMW